jgi:glucosyl-3-phosphoglycerate synthase
VAQAPRTFDHAGFTPAALVAAKGAQTVSVCIPARNEAATVAEVVAGVAGLAGARGSPGLVDEVVVVDDGSADATAALAEGAGARVVTRQGAAPGKGGAMAAGLRATRGDLVVFLDADVAGFDRAFVVRLLGPLPTDQAPVLVKGFYERPVAPAGTGGGRVTELVARPLLELLFPALLAVRQPLAGETAARRSALQAVTFEPGYGVELGLLIDVAAKFGPAAVAQVDLGTRRHRNRTLEELRPQAVDVLAAALRRSHPPVLG